MRSVILKIEFIKNIYQFHSFELQVVEKKFFFCKLKKKKRRESMEINDEKKVNNKVPTINMFYYTYISYEGYTILIHCSFNCPAIKHVVFIFHFIFFFFFFNLFFFSFFSFFFFLLNSSVTSRNHERLIIVTMSVLIDTSSSSPLSFRSILILKYIYQLKLHTRFSSPSKNHHHHLGDTHFLLKHRN